MGNIEPPKKSGQDGGSDTTCAVSSRRRALLAQKYLSVLAHSKSVRDNPFLDAIVDTLMNSKVVHERLNTVEKI